VELKEVQRNWNLFGETDPLGAILTVPSKMRGKWDEREFFQKGVDEIDAVMEYIRPFRPDLPRGEALDFGCGVGRLTQALARHFDRCVGVDIAPSMIALANRYNRFGRRCEYVLNEVNDLSRFGPGRFDFIYTFIVLQHMRPEYSLNYIKEFIRILKPGGLAVFQLPTGPGERDKTTAKPLPDSGFRARVVPIDPPATMRPGAQATVRVRVKNESDSVWPAWWDHQGYYQVRLGNHWCDPSGAVVVLEDDRVDLAEDLAPGGEVELLLTITAPRVPGRYVVEAEMVQEHLAWFHQKGVEPARFPVQVRESSYRRLSQVYRKVVGRGDGGAPTEAEKGPQPAMEMYGVEQAQVEALIREHGGTVLDVQITPCSDWVHARYCVAK
jgi:SAM-dependent methyltransferase